MRRLAVIASSVTLLAVLVVAPVSAAPTTASCPGQVASASAPVLGSEFGMFISSEATSQQGVGAFVSGFARADRENCPPIP